MRKRLMGFMLFVLGGLVVVVFQQVGQTAPALTALDYAEIEQLYARYAVGTDAFPDDGHMLASTFTEDGVFEVFADGVEPILHLEGYDQLKAHLASRMKDDPREAPSPLHYTTNILIEPTPEGARGSAYGLVVGDASDDQRPYIFAKGVYHDELVKTSEGWRFRKRIGTTHRFGDELLAAWAQ